MKDSRDPIKSKLHEFKRMLASSDTFRLLKSSSSDHSKLDNVQEAHAYLEMEFDRQIERAIAIYIGKILIEEGKGTRGDLNRLLQLYFKGSDDTRSALISKALSYNDEEEEVLHFFASQTTFEVFSLL